MREISSSCYNFRTSSSVPFALRTTDQHKAIKVIYRMKEQDLMSRVEYNESK